jgi:TrmH family RNA methyltransferase
VVIRQPYTLLNVARHGCRVLEVVCSDAFYELQKVTVRKLVPDDALVVTSDAALRSLPGGVTSGIIARIAMPERYPLTNLGERILILNKVENPVTVGTILRCAVAFGVESLIVDPGTAAVFSEDVVTISFGHAFAVKLHVSENLPQAVAELVASGVTVVSTAALAKAQLIEDIAFPQRCAVVFGNDRDGVDEAVVEASSFTMRIPMNAPVTSLPVSCAAAIVLHKMTGNTRER